MECGFKVKITQEEIETLLDILPNAHHTSGKQRLAKSDVSRMLVLENFLDEQGRLDARKVENFLFPMCEADIFISHAHDDEELAGALEGLLWHKFGLVAFIDSFVWDTCNQLKSDIEELTCRMDCAEYPELERLDMKLYSHEESIRVSERIDAILTGALIKMMHNVDCMFFLHTNCSAVQEQSTLSPWIYLEQVAFAAMCPCREAVLEEARTAMMKSMDVLFPLLPDLKELDASSFQKWQQSYKAQSGMNIYGLLDKCVHTADQGRHRLCRHHWL